MACGRISMSSIRYCEVARWLSALRTYSSRSDFVSSGGMGENGAYLDRRSGKIYWHSEFGENDEELPYDIDDKKYISIPDKRELDLGKMRRIEETERLIRVYRNANEVIVGTEDEIYSRRGLINRTTLTAAEIGETIVNILEHRLAAMRAQLEKRGSEDHGESR